MSLLQSMNQILDEKTDEVFHHVAKVFAAGGGDKKAKEGLKEILRQLWFKSGEYTTVDILRKFKDLTRNIEEGR